MNRIPTLLAAGALALTAGFALADSHAKEVGAMDHGAMGHGDSSALPGPMQGMMGAMDTMMKTMPTESSGKADADFLLMMIPHHQSAIDMARIQLESGEDEETRTMAQAIIDTQEAEIAQMRAMLERMGVEAPAAE